jgi:hypothetical protein
LAGAGSHFVPRQQYHSLCAPDPLGNLTSNQLGGFVDVAPGDRHDSP